MANELASTPTEQLRAACKALNMNGTGGQKALASLLGCSARTLRYKLTGKIGISERDLLAVRQVSNSPQHTTGGIQGERHGHS